MSIRQLQNPLHHASQTVTALRSDVMLEVKLFEHTQNVVLGNLLCRLAVERGLKNRKQSFDDVRVAVRNNRELRIASVAAGVHDQPDLALASVNSIRLRPRVFWKRWQFVPEFHQVLILVHRIKIQELVEDFIECRNWHD